LILRCLRERQERSQEAGLLNKITQVKSEQRAVRKRKAEILVGQKKYNEALEELKRAEQVETNPADTRTKIGLLYVEQGNFDDADEYQPGAGASRTITASILSRHVYTELSRATRRSASSTRFPPKQQHYVESRLQLAYLYDKKNKYDEALSG